MNKLPSTLTKNQAIKYAVVAFNNFINSGNTSNFDVSIIETFYTGAMEAHDKKLIVDYANNLEEKHKKKMKINIEKIDM
ncbi:MAG: hypothetical protein ACI4U4_01310 [Bacilli bacterium]